MMHVQTHDSENPGFVRVVGVPYEKWEEIMLNNEAAISFARGLIKNYEALPDGKFWEVHKGHRFYFDVNEQDLAMKNIMDNFSLLGEYEPYTTKLIEEHVKPGDVCVDVGASIGYVSMVLARQAGSKGKVYSIEPTENQFEYLKRNIEVNGYTDIITPLNIGAWGEKGNVELKINSGNRIVPVDALDNLLPAKVDFIKIDVDGAEPEVLKGLERTIQSNTDLKMVIEYYPGYIKNLGLNPQDVIDFLNKYFTYVKIDGDYGEDYWNYFCVRKDVL